MAEFDYVAVDRARKKVTGTIDAPGEGDVRMKLRAMGLRPTSLTRKGQVNKAPSSSFKLFGAVTIPLDELVTFTRQLGVLIGSGIPLMQGLEILTDPGGGRSTLKVMLMDIRDKISQGSYLWEALNQYPSVFPKLYIALIRAGEASGGFEQMLKRLSKYLEDSSRLMKMLKSAMMYPIIVVTIASGVIAIMVIFVIPKFEELLSAAGQDLPAPTLLLITVSHFVVGNIFRIVGSAVVSIYLIRRYLRTPEGRSARDHLVYRMPVFGGMAQKAGVARFSRTMQTLLSSGVNLIDAIDICRATIDNAVLEKAMATVRNDVETGNTLASVIGKTGVFPRMAVQMITVGEATGSLDKMLEKVAEFYEMEVETLVGGLSKLIEPFIIVFLGVTVGGIMIAMYLPIFKMASAVG